MARNYQSRRLLDRGGADGVGFRAIPTFVDHLHEGLVEFVSGRTAGRYAPSLLYVQRPSAVMPVMNLFVGTRLRSNVPETGDEQAVCSGGPRSHSGKNFDGKELAAVKSISTWSSRRTVVRRANRLPLGQMFDGGIRSCTISFNLVRPASRLP